MGEESKEKARRGFGAMAPEAQKEIARKGGKSAHRAGRAHEFTTEEARAAGKKGGHAVSRDREHMARIGRLGGLTRQRAVKEGREMREQSASVAREAEAVRMQAATEEE